MSEYQYYEFLAVDRTGVRDLSPIRTMSQLRELRFLGCDVASFAPLLDTRITKVRCDIRSGPNEAILRNHSTIQLINGQPQDAFWSTYRPKPSPSVQGDADSNK